MRVVRTLALACLVLGAQVAPAEAYTISLRQVGGTAVDGVGYVGGDVVVSIDVELEANDSLIIVAPALQWDLEGGNVLDIVRATETPGVTVAGGTLAPINGYYNHAAVGTRPGFGTLVLNGSSFPASFAGPTWVSGWEQAAVIYDDLTGLAGPASFAVGTAKFVFREIGETTLGFNVDPNNPLRSYVANQEADEETGQVTFVPIDLSAIDFQSLSLTVVAVPEPGTALLAGAGLAGLSLASRARARRCRKGARRG
jgi:PEP-CTERM motif